MPPTKKSQKAREFCKITNDKPDLLRWLRDNQPAPFNEEELARLAAAGFVMTEHIARHAERACSITKVELASCSIYVITKSDAFTAHADLDELTRPLHVQQFIDAIAKPDNGWGTPGPKGLLYRGHNVFDLYCRPQFNIDVTEIIRHDDGITVTELEEPCKEFVHGIKHGNGRKKPRYKEHDPEAV